MIAGVVRTLVKKKIKQSALFTTYCQSQTQRWNCVPIQKWHGQKKKEEAADVLCCWDCPPASETRTAPLTTLTFSYHPFNRHKHSLLWPGFLLLGRAATTLRHLQTFKLIFLLLVRLCSRARSQDYHCVDMVALTQNKAVKKMYFKFCLFLLYRNLFFFLFSPGKELSEKLDVFSTLRQRLTFFFFFSNTCSVCSLQLSLVPLYASRQTSRTLSPSPSDDPSLYFYLRPRDVTRATLWTAKKKKKKWGREEEERKRLVSPMRLRFSLSSSLSEAFVRLFQEGERRWQVVPLEVGSRRF